MATITVVGVGPGPVKYLTKEAEIELLGAEKIFFRTSEHPVYQWLKELGKHLHCFDLLYTISWADMEDLYEFMVAALFKEAMLRSNVVYVVPGSADVLEETTNLIRSRALRESVQVRVISGISFLDLVLAEVNFDFSQGLQVVLPLTHVQNGFFTTQLALLVCQIEATTRSLDVPRVDLTMQFLLRAYPPTHVVTRAHAVDSFNVASIRSLR